MTLEEEVLAIEKEAAATVASARAEAKILLASVEQEKQRIADEFATRLEGEKARTAEQCKTKLADALAEIEKEKQDGIKAIEGSAAKKSGDCVDAIMKDLLGE
ncbi:MAG: hypothetical protein P8123_10100 [bacterium]